MAVPGKTHTLVPEARETDTCWRNLKGLEVGVGDKRNFLKMHNAFLRIRD